MFTNRVHTDRDSPSPEPLAKQWDSIHSFIHVCLPESPKRSPHTYIQEKHKVTVDGAPRRRKSYIKWGAAWFHKGIINDNLPLPQSNASFSTITSTLVLAWLGQSPVSHRVSQQPPSRYNLHKCYRLPHDTG